MPPGEPRVKAEQRRGEGSTSRGMPKMPAATRGWDETSPTAAGQPPPRRPDLGLPAPGQGGIPLVEASAVQPCSGRAAVFRPWSRVLTVFRPCSRAPAVQLCSGCPETSAHTGQLLGALVARPGVLRLKPAPARWAPYSAAGPALSSLSSWGRPRTVRDPLEAGARRSGERGPCPHTEGPLQKTDPCAPCG